MDDEKQMDRVQKIPITKLIPFKDHPFRVVEDESMLRTTESISMFGVLTPLIARPMEDGKFEIISGHRRAHAAKAVEGHRNGLVSFGTQGSQAHRASDKVPKDGFRGFHFLHWDGG